MKKSSIQLAAVVLGLVLTRDLLAQYAPPPPPAPFPGFLNEALRKNDPYMNQWDFGGSARLRYENKQGFGIPGVGIGPTASIDFRDHGADVYNDYFLEKIRLRAGYTDKWWSAFVEARSSLVQGDERWAYTNVPPITGTEAKRGQGPESDTIDLHQAYVTVGNHKEFPLSAKVGRQEMIYGEERLIGAFAWNNIGRVFDAAKTRWQNPWFGADIFVGRVVIPEDGQFNEANDYDWFSGVYANSTKIPKHQLEVYFLSRNASEEAIRAASSPQAPQPSARDIYTPGLRLKSVPGELGDWDYTVEGAYQFGNFQDRRRGGDAAPRNTQEAYMFILQGGYTFSEVWAKPRLGLEYAYSSGDSNPTNDTHQTFDNLFPTNHKFYGYMDFVSLQNIQDIRASLSLRPTPRLSVAIEGHGFWLANTHDNFYNVAGAPRGGATLGANVGTGTGYGINPTYNSFVGTELDIIAGYALTRFAQLEVGYGHFFVGDYITSSLSAPTHGAQDANFVYVQATVNF